VPLVRAADVCRLSLLLLFCHSSIASAAVPPSAQLPVFPFAVRWSVEIGGPPVSGAAPVSDDRFVYVALRSGHIVAYDLENGRETWRKEVAVRHPLVADGGLVFAATEDAIHAFRGSDGAFAWEAPASIAAPLVARAGWLVALSSGKAIAFRAADGMRVWERSVGDAVEPPAIEGDRVYVALQDGRLIALQIADGTPLWERSLGAAVGQPFATPERVYAGTSDRWFHCVKATNGDLDWQRRIGGELQGAAAADETMVFIVALDNVMRAYDRGNGNQRWQHALKRRPAAGPFVLGSTVLIPSFSSAEIWAWTTTGKPAGIVATPAEPAVAPAFVNHGEDGALVFVVTGGLTNQWRVTLLATAGDPPLQPLSSLPGETVLTVLPGEVIELKH
jgi:outer membrane protein assembly factor BamB